MFGGPANTRTGGERGTGEEPVEDWVENPPRAEPGLGFIAPPRYPGPAMSPPADARSTPPPPAAVPEERPFVGLADPALLAVLALTLVLQFVAWSALDGYQIADSVEYLERAHSLVRGEAMIDSVSIRPIGFSALLIPFFAVADALGLPDGRPIVWATYLLQIALGLALVHRVARLGARLAGRNAGLVAALFVGANPLFLQYSAQAESGIAAGLCLALGLERVLERGTKRDAWIAGLWFGASFLVAYKSLVVVLAVFLLLLVRDRWKHRVSWLPIVGGLALAMTLQACIDRVMYGRFDASLATYLVQNFGSVTYSTLHRIGLTSLARPIYELVLRFQGQSFEAPPDLGAIGYKGLQGPYWYLEYLHHFLVVPVLVCTAIGALLCVFRARWRSTLLALAFLVFAGATFNKGSKDFRLWIPVLPCLAPIGAWGFVALLGAVRSVAWRRTLGAALLLPAVALGLAMFLTLPHERFGAYWDAMDRANARAGELFAAECAAARESAPAREPAPVQVAAAYNWAVYLRQEPGVELIKLPHQLTGWPAFDDVKKGRDLATIEELDLFVAHQPVLSQHPELLAWVSEHFDVRDLVWSHGRQAETGPLYVLERRSGSPTARRFFDVRTGVDPERFRAERALPPATAFVAEDGSGERLVFLGYEVERVPPDGWWWITYHWWTPTGITRDLTLVDRLTALDERSTWQNDHRGAWGAHPTSEWRAGELVSEGYPLVPAMRAFGADEPWRPIGGGYRRGEALPLRLWMQLVELDPDALKERGERVVRARFVPARRDTFAPLAKPEPDPRRAVLESPDGTQWSGDDFVRVGALFLPTHPRARVANDGRPIPDE